MTACPLNHPSAAFFLMWAIIGFAAALVNIWDCSKKQAVVLCILCGPAVWVIAIIGCTLHFSGINSVVARAWKSLE